MGLFFNFSEINTVRKTLPLNEVDINGQETDNASPTTDYTGGDEGGNTEAPAAEDNAGGETTDTNTEGGGDDAGATDDSGDDNASTTTDYTDIADSESGSGDDSADSGDSGSDDSSSSSSGSSSDSGDGAPVDELKKSEEEIYNSLSPEQLDVMHKELKEKYLALYDTVVSVFDRISEASVSEEHIYVIEYISDKLSRLKQMLVDYVNSIYKGKSYTENYINYNRFFVVLAGINKILEEMIEKQPK